MSNHFKPEIKSLLLIHSILMGGQVILLILFYILAGKRAINTDPEFFKVLQLAVAILAIGSVTMAFVLFKKKVLQLQAIESGLSERLVLYRAASILKFAMIEGPTLFSIIAYFIIPNTSFIVFAVILILMFAMQRPTIPMLVQHLGVDREDLFQ